MRDREIVVRAVLIKRATDDGLVEVEDDVPLGAVYEVDPDTRQTVAFYNIEKHVAHQKEVIVARRLGEGPMSWRFCVTELLRIEYN